MLKILHISSEKSWRGGEQQIAYLINELKKMGVENTVLCDRSSEFEKYCVKNSISHYSAGFHGLLDVYSSAKTLKKIASKFDLVHVHSSKGHSVAYYSYLLGSKAKFIISRRVDFKPNSGFLSRLKYTFKSIEGYICVSDAIRSIMLEYLGDNWKDRCMTIHSGVDLNKNGQSPSFDLKSAYDLSGDIKIIGNTSALADHKDYFTFIDTAHLLIQKNKNLRFFILGNGPLETKIRDYVSNKGLSEFVIFTGFVNNPVDYLKSFDVFLITSKTEGLGTSIIDAFARNVPVVATCAGGIPELVINEQTGILCEIKNPKQLAQGVIKLLNDMALKNSLIANASNHLSGFTKEVTAQKTLEVYRRITNEKF